MNNSMTLSDMDIFCGNSFITTIDEFDSINIDVAGDRVFVNNTFVRKYENSENALVSLQPLIASLEDETIDYVLDIR